MAHEVVRCAQQLFALEPADVDEGLIAVSDLALQIGGGDQALLSGEGALALGDWLVISHSCRFWLKVSLMHRQQGGKIERDCTQSNLTDGLRIFFDQLLHMTDQGF